MHRSTMCAVERKSISSLDLFIGDAIVADLRDKVPAKAITEQDLANRSAPGSAKATVCCCARIRTTAMTAAPKPG